MLEYLDKDETIVAHMAGGIDAYIKLSHGWPIFASPLTLISVKGSDSLKGTSLSFHDKVEVRNSLFTINFFVIVVMSEVFTSKGSCCNLANMLVSIMLFLPKNLQITMFQDALK